MRHRQLSVVCVVTLVVSFTSSQATSLRFVANAAGEFEYGQQAILPTDFGVGEFTLELWVLLDTSFPVGPCQGDQRLVNWCTNDEQPYSSRSWWFDGNWLMDGHNNSGWGDGSFDLQVYGSGRIRWLFGDGLANRDGETWAIQAWPANTTASLLDDQWHQITLVRRWVAVTEAQLELWIDGALIASETSSGRVDMVANYWATWAMFPSDQPGWFWGAEKQVAVDSRMSPLEDYKGLLDEMRYWSRAKSPTEINLDFDVAVTGTEQGIVGWYRLNEGSGDTTCNESAPTECIDLIRTNNINWSPQEAPLGGAAGLIFSDGFE